MDYEQGYMKINIVMHPGPGFREEARRWYHKPCFRTTQANTPPPSARAPMQIKYKIAFSHLRYNPLILGLISGNQFLDLNYIFNQAKMPI